MAGGPARSGAHWEQWGEGSQGCPQLSLVSLECRAYVWGQRNPCQHPAGSADPAVR